MKWRTLGNRLDECKGVGKGFDLIRIFLATAVVANHALLIPCGPGFMTFAPLQLLQESILPMFFALSGFLVTSSALRLRIKDFLINRGMRIVPALLVDIAISALIIGPLFTKLSFVEYFSSPELYAYFGNVMGNIHYTLPGVFTTNPHPNIVNGSLWTIPFEMGCYVLISLLIIFKLLHRKGLCALFCLTIISYIAYCYNSDFRALEHLGEVFTHNAVTMAIYANGFADYGNMLYGYFLLGCLFYVFRYYIPCNIYAFALCVLIYAMAAYRQFDFLPFILVREIHALPLVYVMAYIGLCDIPRLPVFSRGDYSYGIYLYGFPLQQAFAQLTPQIKSPFWHFVLVYPIIVLVAAFSWHYIEKPVLKLRSKFSFTARKGDEAATLPKPIIF